MGKLNDVHALSALAAALACIALSSCSEQPAAPPGDVPAKKETVGDANSGSRAIRELGCGTCHGIPGIRGANGVVGPPLDRMGRRIYIAGLLRNTPDNMMTWLRDPQSIVPGNAMPNMHLSEEQVRNITAYLLTLK